MGVHREVISEVVQLRVTLGLGEGIDTSPTAFTSVFKLDRDRLYT